MADELGSVPPAAVAPDQPVDTATKVASCQWYHTLVLDSVETPGWFDTRPIVDRLPIPERLDGKRCLDVGTFDGFWAFEFERRGAAEVLAVDLIDPKVWDWPANADLAAIAEIGARKGAGSGFEIARETLNSGVRRRELSIYDLDPADIGTFDFVYVGSLLLHLRDPVGGLEAVRRVCHGEVLVVDAIDAALSLPWHRRPLAALDAQGRPWWWKPNVAALVRMVEAAGFDVVDGPIRVRIPRGAGQPRPSRRIHNLRHEEVRVALGRWYLGDRHAALRARPAVTGSSTQ